jgi:hypothetical protein
MEARDMVGWLPYLMIVILTAIPSFFVFKKAGLSPWWAAIAIVPLGTVIILWIVAFSNWPASRPSN